jgi:hypothetical protein
MKYEKPITMTSLPLPEEPKRPKKPNWLLIIVTAPLWLSFMAIEYVVESLIARASRKRRGTCLTYHPILNQLIVDETSEVTKR